MSFERKPAGMEVIDLLDRILDKGIVVDASSRLHLSVANLISSKKHVVIASIETHMEHSEARLVSGMAKRRPLGAEDRATSATRVPAMRRNRQVRNSG